MKLRELDDGRGVSEVIVQYTPRGGRVAPSRALAWRCVAPDGGRGGEGEEITAITKRGAGAEQRHRLPSSRATKDDVKQADKCARSSQYEWHTFCPFDAAMAVQASGLSHPHPSPSPFTTLHLCYQLSSRPRLLPLQHYRRIRGTNLICSRGWMQTVLVAVSVCTQHLTVREVKDQTKPAQSFSFSRSHIAV